MLKMDEILDYIELLEGDSFTHWTEDQKTAYLTACTSIKEFIKKKCEWIDVEDTLPENDEDMLVVLSDDDGPEVQIGWYDEFWRISGILPKHCRITHWQPLPIPPEIK